MAQRNWPAILQHSTEVVSSYERRITLRQLFYRLVVDGVLNNHMYAYHGLSRETAKARRAGTFPRLVDRTRRIDRMRSFESPERAQAWLRDIYRRDRSEGQSYRLYLGVEKDALGGLLADWFADLGVGIVAVKGYPSESLCEQLNDEVASDDRPAVILYAGDFDPSGEDIPRDLRTRLYGIDLVHIGLSAEQVEQHELPPQMGKRSDMRSAAFELRHGRLVQVELDALPPDELHALYQQALDDYWDTSMYELALEREQADLKRL